VIDFLVRTLAGLQRHDRGRRHRRLTKLGECVHDARTSRDIGECPEAYSRLASPPSRNLKAGKALGLKVLPVSWRWSTSDRMKGRELENMTGRWCPSTYGRAVEKISDLLSAASD
jgi:hypothetical protein